MVLSYKNLIEVSVPSQESDEGSCIYVLEVMYLCVKDIDFTSFYDFDIGLWNCPDSGFFFHFIVQVLIQKSSSGSIDSYFLYWKLVYNKLIYYMNKPC